MTTQVPLLSELFMNSRSATSPFSAFFGRFRLGIQRQHFTLCNAWDLFVDVFDDARHTFLGFGHGGNHTGNGGDGKGAGTFSPDGSLQTRETTTLKNHTHNGADADSSRSGRRSGGRILKRIIRLHFEQVDWTKTCFLGFDQRDCKKISVNKYKRKMPGLTISDWGPGAWQTLHAFAHMCPETLSPEEQKNMKAFLKLLPCICHVQNARCISRRTWKST